MPVSARTSALLPWSMWPAVPTITDFMAHSVPFAKRVSFRVLVARIES